MDAEMMDALVSPEVTKTALCRSNATPRWATISAVIERSANYESTRDEAELQLSQHVQYRHTLEGHMESHMGSHICIAAPHICTGSSVRRL